MVTKRGKQASFVNGCLRTVLCPQTSKLTGSFLFRECHVLTLVQHCGFEAQKIADLRSVLATFCGQEMAGASGGLWSVTGVTSLTMAAIPSAQIEFPIYIPTSLGPQLSFSSLDLPTTILKLRSLAINRTARERVSTYSRSTLPEVLLQ